MSKPKNPKTRKESQHPRKCIVCSKTKPADQFCKHAVYVCEDCYEKRWPASRVAKGTRRLPRQASRDR
jgi:hypothetical protein